MDLIWLSHFIPYPARGGAAQRSYNLLREASRRHRVSFFAFNRPERSSEELEASRREFESFCHRVEFFDLPFRWKGASWWAHLLLSPLTKQPMAVRAYYSKRLDERWNRILSEYGNALVHIDSSDLAAFLPAACRFPVVLNHHNCESAMLFRRAQMEANPVKSWMLKAQAQKQRGLEADALNRVALNLAVSDEDVLSLQQVDREASFRVVENGTDTEFFEPGNACDENTIVFAGSLRWYPNQAGLMYFSREVWPILKATRPGIQFLIAGQDPPNALIHWAQSDPQITLVANPDDIRPWIARGSVYVCPILDGGGSRLKLLDAMAMGKAIVTTRVGAEGLRVEANVHMMIVETAREFAEQVLRLLDDDAARRRLADAARHHAVAEYSWPVIGQRLMSAYEAALESGTHLEKAGSHGAMQH